jgi:hypothetical protein
LRQRPSRYAIRAGRNFTWTSTFPWRADYPFTSPVALRRVAAILVKSLLLRRPVTAMRAGVLPVALLAAEPQCDEPLLSDQSLRGH